ncbi:MAG: Fur family transcriptional regulator [Candidatus Uhrbacteria bacterium]
MKKLANVELYSVLYRAGMKITGSRVEILRILCELDAPVGVPELFDIAVNRNITYATAYRTLDAFATAGIVRKVDLRHGHVDYELVKDKHDHHHIVCTGCGKIEDFDGCEVEAVIKKALRGSKEFQEVSDHALELFGRCKGCVSS